MRLESEEREGAGRKRTNEGRKAGKKNDWSEWVKVEKAGREKMERKEEWNETGREERK